MIILPLLSTAVQPEGRETRAELQPLPLPLSKHGPTRQLSLPVTGPETTHQAVSGLLALPSSHTCLLWNTKGFFITAQELSCKNYREEREARVVGEETQLLGASVGPHLRARVSEADLLQREGKPQ